MERPVVAVVDDGVNDGLFSGAPPLLDLEVDAAGKVVPRREAGGTSAQSRDGVRRRAARLCARLRCGQPPGGRRQNRLGRCEALVRAVDWCAAQGLRQINLSNGSVQFFDFDALHACARRAREAGGAARGRPEQRGSLYRARLL